MLANIKYSYKYQYFNLPVSITISKPQYRKFKGQYQISDFQNRQYRVSHFTPSRALYIMMKAKGMNLAVSSAAGMLKNSVTNHRQ